MFKLGLELCPDINAPSPSIVGFEMMSKWLNVQQFLSSKFLTSLSAIPVRELNDSLNCAVEVNAMNTHSSAFKNLCSIFVGFSVYNKLPALLMCYASTIAFRGWKDVVILIQRTKSNALILSF
jgi:hypothetical protein